MSTCGYICPKCEGSGFLEDGSVCDWCSKREPKVSENSKDSVVSMTDEEWIKEVHEGKCCGDE